MRPSRNCQDLTYAHLSRCGAVEGCVAVSGLQVVCEFVLRLDWQGFQSVFEICAVARGTTAGRHFRAAITEFSTKLSTGPADRLQFFSRIQSLASKVRFYFNFDVFTSTDRLTRFDPLCRMSAA